MKQTSMLIDGYVSLDDECSASSRNDVLISKVDELSKLISHMSLRLHELETKLAHVSSDSVVDKISSQDASHDDDTSNRKKSSVKTDDYIMFSAGDNNRKGGVYTYNHLTRVLVSDEMRTGLLVDETRCFFRIRFDHENYYKGCDGRLKKKHLVKPHRSQSSKR